jgi:hypothetical protein
MLERAHDTLRRHRRLSDPGSVPAVKQRAVTVLRALDLLAE